MFISDILAQKRPVFSFEFFPPKTDEAARLLEKTIAELGPLEPDFVSVTYGAGGTTREKTSTSSAGSRRYGHRSDGAPDLRGRDAGRPENVLDRLVDAGVENVLALRGDPPKGETTFSTPKAAFDMRTNWRHSFGEQYDGKLCIGGACYPEKHPESSIRLSISRIETEGDRMARSSSSPSYSSITAAISNLWRYARDNGSHRPDHSGHHADHEREPGGKMTSMCGVSLPYRLAAALDSKPRRSRSHSRYRYRPCDGPVHRASAAQARRGFISTR